MLGYNPRRDPRDQTNRYNVVCYENSTLRGHQCTAENNDKIKEQRIKKMLFFRPGGFLYTWDGGNQLSYPVKYHDIGKHQRHSHQSGTIWQQFLIIYIQEGICSEGCCCFVRIPRAATADYGAAGDASLHRAQSSRAPD
jgi:hypothetical protein